MEDELREEMERGLVKVMDALLAEEDEIDIQVWAENCALWVCGKYNVKRMGE